MDLNDYLIQLNGGSTSAPDNLTLPASFALQLVDLYTAAEARGLERGGPLLWDRGTGTFALGEVAEGQKTSVQIPVTNHAGNFGDVHAHPSTSIGHAGGYSAHSMSDLRKFSQTTGKPFWIQVVTSGPWLYAMVQVNGVSKWDAAAEKFFTDRNSEEVSQMKETVRKFVGGEPRDKILKQLGTDPDPADYGRLYDEYKAKAKVGALMQQLSVKHCAEFAREYNFFFYTGQGGTLTRMFSLPV